MGVINTTRSNLDEFTFVKGSKAQPCPYNCPSAVNMNNDSVFIASKSLVRHAGNVDAGAGNTLIGNGSMTNQETDKLKKLALLVAVFVVGFFVVKKLA